MIVAEHFGFVVGIDTHAKTHTLAIIDTATGGERANETFPATSTGGKRALSWILRRTEASPEQVLLFMEGTGSYGAKLRQQATDADFQVTEAPVPNQRLGRYQGKSDAIDAARAARATLSIPMDRLREPRSGQNHMALRVLTNARRTMARERTAAINGLTALLRVVDLGMDARTPLTGTQINTIAAWRERDEEFGVQTCRREAVRLAKQILTLQCRIPCSKHRSFRPWRWCAVTLGCLLRSKAAAIIHLGVLWACGQNGAAGVTLPGIDAFPHGDGGIDPVRRRHRPTTQMCC